MFYFTVNSVIILKHIFVMLLLCPHFDFELTNTRRSCVVTANEMYRCLRLVSRSMRMRYVQHGAQKGRAAIMRQL